MAASVALLSDGFVTAPAVEEDEEAVPLSQSTQLLQRKKEMAAVQLELDKKKDEFLSRMRRCTEREEELAERQDAIKEQVRKFDKFLKENDAKRARALRKAGEEAKIREAREAERVALEAELLRQRAAQGEIEAALRNLERPEQFLARACEHSDYFEDIEAILRRHEVLEATHADLLARVKTSEEQTLQRREELHETRKRAQTEALVNASRIAAHQARLDELRLGAQDEEASLASMESGAKDRLRVLGEVTMAIHNLHARAFEKDGWRAGGAGRPPDGGQGELLPELLSSVGQRVGDLLDIVATLRHEVAVHSRC